MLINRLKSIFIFVRFTITEQVWFRFPPRCKWDLCSSGMLHCVVWQ